jgi:peptide/nickel transport system permease protein
MSAITASPENTSAYQRIAPLVGLAGLGLIAVIVALGDAIAGSTAGAIDAGPYGIGPNAHFLFGTDMLGRDIFSETIHALAVTFGAALIGAIIVVLAGAVAGFAAARAPLRAGSLLRTITGALGAVPLILLTVIFASILGHGLVAIAAGLAAAPVAFNRSFDRAAQLAQSRHAVYARATGIPGATLLRRDLVYEVQGNLIKVSARALAATTIAVATISFLGFGAVAPHRDLGLLIADARPAYFDLWWTALFPALVLGLLILFARLAARLEEGEAP